jgi:hypothetical protein
MRLKTKIVVLEKQNEKYNFNEDKNKIISYANNSRVKFDYNSYAVTNKGVDVQIYLIKK